MEESERNNNSVLKAGLVIALALAAILGYLYFKERQKVDDKIVEVSQVNRDLMIASAKLDSIGTQLDSKIAEISALGGQVEELQALKAQLDKDKRNLIYSKNVNLKDYQSKIAGYESALAEKDIEISKLREANVILTNQNETLITQKTELIESNAALQNTKAALSDSVYSISVKNAELSDKVSMASALRPMNYAISAINSRGKEIDGSEFKARRVEKIKIAFKLAENPLTKKENKTIYLRLLDNNGNVISDMATGSGTFSFGGKETVYTAKQTVMFTNDGQTVDFVYDRGAGYEAGSYTAVLFSEGYRIGQTSWDIK
jgi:FtsZ-binding cell division protein ZapB